MVPDAPEAATSVATRVLWSGVHGTSALSMSDQLFTDRWQADREMIESLVNGYLDGWTAKYG